MLQFNVLKPTLFCFLSTFENCIHIEHGIVGKNIYKSKHKEKIYYSSTTDNKERYTSPFHATVKQRCYPGQRMRQAGLERAEVRLFGQTGTQHHGQGVKTAG